MTEPPAPAEPAAPAEPGQSAEPAAVPAAAANPGPSAFSIADDLNAVDWAAVKADLLADDFDNGRSAAALRRSFEASAHTAIAWEGDVVVGTARLLSDGVCNAYLVDVWTRTTHRRQGIGRAMVTRLIEAVPGQHIGLQTDDQQAFYATVGFRPQPEYLSYVSGAWLDNDANR